MPNTPDSYPPELTERRVGAVDRQLARWVSGDVPVLDPIVLVDPDPAWPGEYARAAAGIVEALGAQIITIEHVGSTSVLDLPAKPIIDIDVQVADSSREVNYAPALEAADYRHLLREPWWNGHRMFVRADNGVNLHIFQAGSPEPLRHLLFRDWLRTHDGDREYYAAAKRRLAAQTADEPDSYNLAKNAVIDEIYSRIFSAPPKSHAAWPVNGWRPAHR